MSDAAPSRLRIAIVGSGRVGAVLGAAWHRAGHRIVGATARSETSRLRADALLPGVRIADPSAVAADADLVLVAVPDPDLPGVVEELVESGSATRGTNGRVRGRVGAICCCALLLGCVEWPTGPSPDDPADA
ncbi:MAG: NAD(P)-binding domain-containing protein, partial [Actinomycetia bacterium]|nr:NAD(P)-binding domain-containing protein [Actinomycetes bacterium]